MTREVASVNSALASPPVSDSLKSTPLDKLQRFRELRQATDNEHGMAYVKRPNGTAVIAIASLDKRDVITLPAGISQEHYEQIVSNILPIPETQYMMYEIAKAYANRTPIMLEGGTAIGKTFAVNCFAELLYGPGAKIPDFYCNGQTDVSELMGKYVPAGLTARELRRIDDYLKSDAGVALKAEVQQSGNLTAHELLERAALELRIPIRRGSFEFQLGVLPKAMTGTMSPDGIMLETPDGPGCMLHIQEVGMAAPSVVNALLKIRGVKGKLAADIQVHEDGGRLIEAGEGFFLVLSTNPPGRGFKERFEVDSALARALVWKTLPDQLAATSLEKISDRIFDCSKVVRREDSDGAIIDLTRHQELATILGVAVFRFHQVFQEKLVDGEPGRKQKIPATIDSLWKVAEILQNHQIPTQDNSSVDFVATLTAAIQGIYIDALRDKPEIVASRSLGGAAKTTQSLGAVLLSSLDSVLTNRQLEEMSFRGGKTSRKEAIEILTKEAMGHDTGTALREEATSVVTSMEIDDTLDRLAALLPKDMVESLKMATGLASMMPTDPAKGKLA
jgi:hypothetical protein